MSKQAKVGIEMDGTVYPVRAIEPTDPGWVKVAIEVDLLYLVPERGDFPVGSEGVLAVVTPREKLLQESLGTLDHVFAHSNLHDPGYGLYFVFRQKGR